MPALERAILRLCAQAESAVRESYGETVAGVLVALLLYWLAHAYSELVGWRLEEAEPLTPAGLRGKAVGIVLSGGNVDLDRLPWMK